MLEINTKLIIDEIHKYDGYTQAHLLQDCIHEKLTATVLKYNEEIEDSTDYLLTRSSAKVLKALTKIQKADDKELLKTLELEKEETEKESESEETTNE